MSKRLPRTYRHLNGLTSLHSGLAQASIGGRGILLTGGSWQSAGCTTADLASPRELVSFQTQRSAHK